MTIIAVKGSMMAADSASFQDDIMFPSAHPKIIRAPDGGLVGACGAAGDCQILRNWVAAGMDFDKPPKFSHPDATNDKSLLWLWLKPDLSVEMGDSIMNHWIVPSPVVIGSGAGYLHGLLDGGIDLAEAVRRAIERVQYIGGPVQAERINA